MNGKGKRRYQVKSEICPREPLWFLISQHFWEGETFLSHSFPVFVWMFWCPKKGIFVFGVIIIVQVKRNDFPCPAPLDFVRFSTVSRLQPSLAPCLRLRPLSWRIVQSLTSTKEASLSFKNVAKELAQFWTEHFLGVTWKAVQDTRRSPPAARAAELGNGMEDRISFCRTGFSVAHRPKFRHRTRYDFRPARPVLCEPNRTFV